MNEGYEENLQNPLEKYGRDITESVKQGKVDPVIGRDDEIRSISRILSRKTIRKPKSTKARFRYLQKRM